MPSATTLPINPDVLTWARMESGYDVDRVAHRLGTKEERVLAWERGDAHPTLHQVQLLAAFFRRPLGLFFQPKPPKVAPLAADYRRLPGVVTGHESPAMRLAIRQMLLRRDHMLNLLGELGEEPVEFKLAAHLAEQPEAVAHRLREALGIPVLVQLRWRDEWQALNAWRNAVEHLGILVFQFSKVELEEARGLTLLRFPLPVVAVNGKELPEPRLFTLIHEVAHLMLAVGKEEVSALRETRTAEQWTSVEQFAESVASHALVPEDALRSLITGEGFDAQAWGIPEVRRLARRFRLSPLAMATRLRASGYMTWPQYRSWKAAWDEFVAALPPRAGGLAAPVDMAVTRNGRPFTQVVLEALHSNRITAVEASRYLELKYEHFGKLQEKILTGLLEGTSHA